MVIEKGTRIGKHGFRSSPSCFHCAFPCPFLPSVEAETGIGTRKQSRTDYEREMSEKVKQEKKKSGNEEEESGMGYIEREG